MELKIIVYWFLVQTCKINNKVKNVYIILYMRANQT